MLFQLMVIKLCFVNLIWLTEKLVSILVSAMSFLERELNFC